MRYWKWITRIVIFVFVSLIIIVVRKEDAFLPSIPSLSSSFSWKEIALFSAKQNSNILGVLKIPGTTIEEFVVQAEDNEYYLTHDFRGRKDPKGALFLDARATLTSRKKIIFGHSSTSLEIPFRALERYHDFSYWKTHSQIEWLTRKKKETYQIFSIFLANEDSSYMKMLFPTEEEWYHHLLWLKERSFYDTGISVAPKDVVLLLQTCDHSSDSFSSYLLIAAKRTETIPL